MDIHVDVEGLKEALESHRVEQESLRARVATLEERFLSALASIADLVCAVKAQGESLRAQTELFSRHVLQEDADRARLTEAVEALRRSLQPLVDERAALRVLGDAIVRGAAIVAGAASLIAFGPRVIGWLLRFLGG